MNTILIVEDDKNLSEGIKLLLKAGNYCCCRCSNSFIQRQTMKAARSIIKGNNIQLILLDLSLPDGNSIDLPKEIRQKYDTPIIIITANDVETDIVMGLELGANDYITKPFSLMALRARVGVQLRQNRLSQAVWFQSGEFDFDKMVFIVRGSVVELSKTEQKLLRILILKSILKRKAEIEQELIYLSVEKQHVTARSLIEQKANLDMMYQKKLLYVYGIAIVTFVLILINPVNSLKYRIETRKTELNIYRTVGMDFSSLSKMIQFENAVFGIISLLFVFAVLERV